MTEHEREALEAQCQRDFALAAEWQATAEEYRVRAEVAETSRANALASRKQFADALELERAECEALRAEVERLGSRDRTRDAFVAELQRELASLQFAREAELNARGRFGFANAETLVAAETRLAAATELLSVARSTLHVVTPHFAREVDAFLAAQPAAPARTEGES